MHTYKMEENNMLVDIPAASTSTESVPKTEEKHFSVDTTIAMSGAELNKKLIALAEFTCNICKKCLYPPVMLVPEVGNVCGFCKTVNGVEVAVKGVRNEAFESVLRQLMLPCRYASRGCPSLLNFENMDHFEICRYRDLICPLTYLGACEWSGNLKDLVEHSLIHHTSSVVMATRNEIKFSINIGTDDGMKFLYINKFKLVIRFKCNEDKLQFLVYSIGTQIKHLGLFYIIEHPNLGNLGNENGNGILHEEQLKSYFDENYALTISLVAVKEFIVDSVLNLTIRLKKAETMDQVDEKMLSHFRCPACSTYMRAAIYQYPSGHSVCNQCKPNCLHCPTCDTSFSNMRNYSMEKLIEDVDFPCTNRQRGCFEVFRGKDILQHEAECHLQNYQCPFNDDCNWKGIYSTIVEHLQIFHKDKVKFTYRNVANYKLNTDVRCCLIAYGQIFRCMCGFDNNNLYWSVQLVGPKSYAKEYKFKIEIYQAECKYRKYIRSSVCGDLTNDEHKIRMHSIKIPYEHIMRFASSNERFVSYCCKIKRIDI